MSRRRIRPWLITLVLWVIALTAVALTVPVLRAGRHVRAAQLAPPAPGLAARSNAGLLDLLPHPGDFPDGWAFSPEVSDWEDFGDDRPQVADRTGGLPGYQPAECESLITMVSTGTVDAAEVAGYDPQHPGGSYDRKDVQLTLAREFDPAGFTDMVALVGRCTEFTYDGGPYHDRYTVHAVEDDQTGPDAREFRYRVTTHTDAAPGGSHIRSYAYARGAHLVVRGTATEGHRGVLDALFSDTVARIHAASG